MAAILSAEAALDLAIAVIVLEAILLGGYRVATGKGIALVRLLPNLAAGAALLLAARAIAASAPWAVVGACLATGLAAHVTDLVVRWREE